MVEKEKEARKKINKINVDKQTELQKNNRYIQTKNTKLENALNVTQKENEQQSEVLEKYKIDNKTLNQQKSQLNKKNEELKKTVKDADAEIKKTAEMWSQRSIERTEWKNKEQNYKTNLTKAEEHSKQKKEEYKNNLALEREKIQELEETFKENTAQIVNKIYKEQEEGVKFFENQISDLDKQTKKLAYENVEYKKQKGNFKEQLEHLNTNHQKEIEQIRKELKEANELLKREQTTSTNNLALKNKQIKNLQNQLETNQEKTKEIREELKKENELLKKTNKQLTETITEVEQTNGDLTRENKQYLSLALASFEGYRKLIALGIKLSPIEY